MFAIITTNFINKSDFKNYPFGKATLEPMIVIIKSLVLLIMCVITMLSSIKQVLNGGNDVEAGFALGYALISSVGCTAVYLYMRKASKNLNSEIVKVESNQWLMDSMLSVFALGYALISSVGCTAVYLYMRKASKNLNSEIVKVESNQWLMDSMLSVGVLVGFLISILLKYIGLENLSSYVDPGMVILSSTIFLKMPITSIMEAFKEITNSTADDQINYDINLLVKEIEEEYNLEESIARVAKVGRELRIEIDFIVSKDSKIKSIEDMDKVREIIDKNTNHFDLKKWMNVSFTKNKKWAI